MSVAAMPPVVTAALVALAAPQIAAAQGAGPAVDPPAMETPAMAMPAAAPTRPPADQAATAPDEPKGTDQPPGSAPPPPVAHDRPADRYWDPAAMARAHSAMMDPHAAPSFGAMRVDLAEYQLGLGKAPGGDGYRWEGEGWLGDVNRLVLRTRGEGAPGGRLEHAEVEAAWSRAISPWWNLQMGLRQDIRPTPTRTQAMLAIEGLAPYRFDVLAGAFVSDKGQVTARIEATLDERITRRLVMQPRGEINLSAQDMPDQRLGAGLTLAELGVRLRYEVTRKWAPYVGVSWSWASGRSADYRRIDGERAAATALVFGLKSWF